jgi:ectoine hydroxylase-related dioxygenase (phytanoyl-CoA dioxygenase family)
MIHKIIDDMNRDGYSILKNVVNHGILNEIRENLDNIYEKDHDRFGSEFLMQINELEVVRNVMEYHDVFAKLLDQTDILDQAVEALLHPYAIIHNYNLIRLFTDIKTKMLGHQWHRDVYYFGPGIRTGDSWFSFVQRLAR